MRAGRGRLSVVYRRVGRGVSGGAEKGRGGIRGGNSVVRGGGVAGELRGGRDAAWGNSGAAPCIAWCVAMLRCWQGRGWRVESTPL
jgi:hypothetical protein